MSLIGSAGTLGPAIPRGGDDLGAIIPTRSWLEKSLHSDVGPILWETFGGVVTEKPVRPKIATSQANGGLIHPLVSGMVSVYR